MTLVARSDQHVIAVTIYTFVLYRVLASTGVPSRKPIQPTNSHTLGNNVTIIKALRSDGVRLCRVSTGDYFRMPYLCGTNISITRSSVLMYVPTTLLHSAKYMLET